jgi:hypothetical protein
MAKLCAESPHLYEEIKAAALKLNQWETVRDKVRADLKEEGHTGAGSDLSA